MILIYTVYIIYIYNIIDPCFMQIPSPMAWLHRSGSWWHRPPCRAVRGADLIISTWADLGGFADNSLCFLVPAPSVGPWSWSLAHCIYIYIMILYMILHDFIWYYMILYAHPPLIFQRCALSAVSQLLSALYPAKKFWIITVFWKKREPPNTYHLS